MPKLLEAIKNRITSKRELPTNLNTAVGLIGWLIQNIGILILHILVTIGFIFGAYFVIRITLISPFWLMTILSIVLVACSLVGIAAIIIDMSDIVCLIQELRKGNYNKALKFLKTISFICTTLILIVVLVVVILPDNEKKEIEKESADQITEQADEVVEYPIQDIWVFRYNYQTGKSEMAACGYMDEYTSAVIDTEEDLRKLISGSYMYLGTIKGYQNEDKTMEVFQVRLPEISENFVLTNDNVELDYSGNRKMIEVTGWIYMDGTTILAVSPLYSETEN